MGKYKFSVGLKKTFKNFLYLWSPAILAFLAKVPIEYGAIAGFVIYFIKNYIQNK
ncbi:MAG: hypothetical protein IIA87_03210 [Nanoarchaeota archaeon]|nr:hypothetical protein [Nanoarchaeota archaeon]